MINVLTSSDVDDNEGLKFKICGRDRGMKRSSRFIPLFNSASVTEAFVVQYPAASTLYLSSRRSLSSVQGHDQLVFVVIHATGALRWPFPCRSNIYARCFRFWSAGFDGISRVTSVVDNNLTHFASSHFGL